MKKNELTGISFFQRYLTVWVFLCMVVGVLTGHLAPALPELLNRFEYARVSIPMAILIWIMIYPMMLKVDFQSVRNVGKNPKGLFVVVHASSRDEYGDRCQEVEIYLNFIGKFDVPLPELTPEELAEEEVQRKKRARNRQKYERKKERQKLIEAGQMQPGEGLCLLYRGRHDL